MADHETHSDPADDAVPTEDPRPDGLRSADSLVLVNTGNGKGKSSSAFGMMIRAVARGWNVAVVQFIKSGDWKVGEEKIGRELGVDWHAFGDGFTWDSDDLTNDRAHAAAGWAKAAEIMQAGEHQLVIFDELTYLPSFGWIDVNDIVRGSRHPTQPRQRDHHRTRCRTGVGRVGRHRHRDARGQARIPTGNPCHAWHRLLSDRDVIDLERTARRTARARRGRNRGDPPTSCASPPTQRRIGLARRDRCVGGRLATHRRTDHRPSSSIGVRCRPRGGGGDEGERLSDRNHRGPLRRLPTGPVDDQRVRADCGSDGRRGRCGHRPTHRRHPLRGGA